MKVLHSSNFLFVSKYFVKDCRTATDLKTPKKDVYGNVTDHGDLSSPKIDSENSLLGKLLTDYTSPISLFLSNTIAGS